MMFRLTEEQFKEMTNTTKAVKTAPKLRSFDNKYKQSINLILLSLQLDYVKEYAFMPGRRWRIDWALPAIKVGIEYEGLNFIGGGPSGHQTIKGVAAGNEKYSEAAIAGWCMIFVNAISVDSGLAHDLIRRAVSSRALSHAPVASKRRTGNVSDL